VRVLFTIPRSLNPKQMYREYPLGVGLLGTILQQQGHEISIFDQNVEAVEPSALLDQVAAFRPDVVGFSIITPNYPVARQQVALLKEHYPEIRIWAGGVHPSLFPQDLLADGVDVVVVGEGESVIAELAARTQRGRGPEDLPGLVFRERSGEILRTAAPTEPVALEALPVVNRSLYNLSRYPHHSMLASRGCPHHCDFCCNYTGTDRRGIDVRPWQGVLVEMAHLREAYGAKEVFFADDLFLLRETEILQFCRALSAQRLGVRWIAQMRVDQVSSEVATAMAQADCQRLYLGLESGSDTILRHARKGLGTAHIRRGVQAAKAAGLRVKTGWIYGLPGTLEEQYKSIPFMRELRPHEISIHQLIPFPGTVYYAEPGRYRIRIANPKAFESFCYGGLDGGIQFDYLSQRQLLKLLEETVAALEADGYVSSDDARPDSEYVYTTPLSRNSMNVFRPPVAAVAL
jgi:anaerobic magnesium-protoporphyrin IX monomethyl ester cyclase